MTIVLHGGPANDEEHDNVPATTGVFTRYSLGPQARYKATSTIDHAGRHIFKLWPLEDGIVEQSEGVHHA